ncbi:hypothetical protein [Halomonas sp. KM-1]|uniref:hypothetical protein n=1 Tax=Halomonas sp. KM-1 TaxID=590061 RepID=UPI00114764F6|nr:hypothetical protein [Halomonas sp. KM-1]
MDIDFFNQAKDVFLEAEVNPDRAAAFEQKCTELTGAPPILGEGYQHQPNKWGSELRAYFNSDVDLFDEFAAIGIEVEHGARPYRENRRYRVNNAQFVWELLGRGYRLGEN